METRPNSFIVGVFVLLLLAAGTAFVLWFSKMEIGKSHHHYYIFFEGAVTGLRENTDVLYQGIPVGKVKKIRVYKNNVQNVKVLVNIDRPDIIRENSIATIEAQGLTGYTFVQIKGSAQESPVLSTKGSQKHPVIQSRPSNLEALFSNAPKILEDISGVATQLRKFFDDQMITESKKTLGNLARITEDLSKGTSSLADFVIDFRSSLKDFKSASASFNRTITENEEALSTFISTGLPAFTKMSQSLKQTSDHFDKLSKEFEKSPASFLKKNSNQGYKVQ
ncbi:MAG: MlaD family protein [Alphaproteobacteria bacterium]|nr:MlaD family protein [Alphaproteobacteria bacterium]